MKSSYENDRLFFVALILMALSCHVFESFLNAYGVPEYPLRFALKCLSVVISVGVISTLMLRYHADRYALFFITTSIFCFAGDSILDVDAVSRVFSQMLGMTEARFSRSVDNSIEKGGIFALILSLVTMITSGAQKQDKLHQLAAAHQSAEERLVEREESYRIMFEQSPCAICHLADNGELVMVNQQLCELIDYSQTELLGRLLKELVEPEDWVIHKEAMERRLKPGQSSVSYEVRYRHKNGFTIWAQNTINRVQTEGLKRGYWIVVSEDITDRKRRLVELSESVSLLEATLESTTDGLLVVGLEGRINRYNQRFLEMWQIPNSVIASRVDEEVMDYVLDQLEEPDVFLARVKALYRRPEEASFEVLHFKDGRVFERYSQSQQVDGKPVGRVWSFRDVTQSHRSQADQAHLHTQLREAQKLEALGSLSAGVAHDFNNQLSSIVANTEVALALAAEAPEVKDCLEEVLESCNRSRSLVDRIMGFSRLQPRRLELVSMADLVEEAILLIRPGLSSRIEIEAVSEPDLPFVLGDKTQIHQILLNLCSNAATAIESRSGRITVECRKVGFDISTLVGRTQVSAGNYLCLRVSDSGRGMSPEVLERAFEPLFTTKGTGEGTGLGLAVVQNIVKNHQGAVRLLSEEGAGTTAEVYFPESTVSVTSSQEVADNVTGGQGERILYLDDEETVARSVSKRLSQLNYVVETFNDPAAALKRVEEGERIDLLMTDLTMPNMDGLELVNRIRKLRPDLPVVLLTGYGDPRINDEASKAGVAVVLRKPVSSASISWAVRDALSRQGNRSLPTKYVV